MNNIQNTSPEFQKLFGNYQTAITDFINANDALEAARTKCGNDEAPELAKVSENYKTACQAEFDAREAIAAYPVRTMPDKQAKAAHFRQMMKMNDIQKFEIEGLIRAFEA